MLLAKKIICEISFCAMIICISSCSNDSSKISTTKTSAGISKTDWVKADGKQVFLFALTNKTGMQVKISNYGGTIAAWKVPDKNGNENNIVIGFDSLSGYLAKPPYFGATIGDMEIA